MPDLAACRTAANAASVRAAHDPERARGKYATPLTTVVFLDRGTSVAESPCFVSVRPPTVGDEILVGVYTRPRSSTPTAWKGVTYDPCSLESASPNVLESQKLSPSGQQGEVEEDYQVLWLWSRRCFDPSVRVSITGTAPGSDVTQSFTLKQYARYQATVQAGVISTALHDGQFGLRPVGSDKLIYEKGPTAKGPEYVATVVLYGIPHYLGSLVGQPRYRGRDVVNDQELLDRVGGVLGVGLSKPSDHFVAGFSFELLDGVNATGTWHWAQVRELAGVKAGDVFAAAADEIPTRNVWEREFAGGISLDLRYATRLFSK